MLSLPRALVDQVLAHARRDHPDECCGVIAGKDGTATRLFEMENAERSPTGFTFDSTEWLRVYRDVDDADEELLAVYHSHTATEAYPSRTDVLWAQHNEFAHWLLVSTRSDEDEVRSFTITEGVVSEEPVTIT
ncbi:MAG TPA: M67 family metallopeptidase [Mycobacteriales bacterium]|nr:M67 family metallopeptidase [Mycobacteriales bacterium]